MWILTQFSRVAGVNIPGIPGISARKFSGRPRPSAGRVLRALARRSVPSGLAFGPASPPDAKSRRRARTTPGRIRPVMVLALSVASNAKRWSPPATIFRRLQPPMIGGSGISKPRAWAWDPADPAGGRRLAPPALGPFVPRPQSPVRGEG